MVQKDIAADLVERSIVLLRGHRVLLDGDLARLYGVEVRALVQAVKRNVERFPRDFMFQLSREEERRRSRSQIVILNAETTGKTEEIPGRSTVERRGRNVKYLPYAFTEQGVAMLSSVLRSSRAIQVNIEIMRAFVRLRQLLLGHEALAKKVAALEEKYDVQFRVVFDAIRELMDPDIALQEPIGFKA